MQNFGKFNDYYLISSVYELIQILIHKLAIIFLSSSGSFVNRNNKNTIK